jgi:very-short-patch-repair endonuclease
MKNKHSRFMVCNLVAERNKGVIEVISSKTEWEIQNKMNEFGLVEGTHFFHQYSINDTFIVDFAFPKSKLVVEVDGDSHRGKKQIQIDYKRDSYLSLNGWKVIRVTNKDFLDDPGFWCKVIILNAEEDLKDPKNGLTDNSTTRVKKNTRFKDTFKQLRTVKTALKRVTRSLVTQQ